nr:hypothetical protein [Paraburkholderia tropica]
MSTIASTIHLVGTKVAKLNDEIYTVMKTRLRRSMRWHGRAIGFESHRHHRLPGDHFGQWVAFTCAEVTVERELLAHHAAWPPLSFGHYRPGAVASWACHSRPNERHLLAHV